MISVRDLPAVNACLNATAAVLLVWGYTLIRRHRQQTHKRVMIAAFALSASLTCWAVVAPPFPRRGRMAFLALILMMALLIAKAKAVV